MNETLNIKAKEYACLRMAMEELIVPFNPLKDNIGKCVIFFKKTKCYFYYENGSPSVKIVGSGIITEIANDIENILERMRINYDLCTEDTRYLFENGYYNIGRRITNGT